VLVTDFLIKKLLCLFSLGKKGLVFVFSLGILFGHQIGTIHAAEDEVIQIKESAKHLSVEDRSLTREAYQGFAEAFSADLSINVVLGDVILLVIIVNILALFNKPRLIMVTSYLFCFKWVFWSNYSFLLKQSDGINIVSSSIFLLCGLSTLVLFCMNRFEKDS